MDDPYTFDRRGFLRTGASAAAAAAAACGGPTSRFRVFTEAEAATLAAVCDQIVPPDDAPGAAQAGAVDFIDRQLATKQKDRIETYRRALPALDASARRRHSQPFAALGFDAQTAILRDVEKSAVEAGDWDGVEPASFFEHVRSHTMMGFYGDPRHGGNKERVSWRMLGVPDPPIRGRLHEAPSKSDSGPAAPTQRKG
jgi:gluconate 2-dehydrogenase gamma chain